MRKIAVRVLCWDNFNFFRKIFSEKYFSKSIFRKMFSENYFSKKMFFEKLPDKRIATLIVVKPLSGSFSKNCPIKVSHRSMLQFADRHFFEKQFCKTLADKAVESFKIR